MSKLFGWKESFMEPSRWLLRHTRPNGARVHEAEVQTAGKEGFFYVWRRENKWEREVYEGTLEEVKTAVEAEVLPELVLLAAVEPG